ncbi:hypothetical protein PISMIDRAFT_19692 [Pisolithus microcarpus 441]|uniref:Uncharacterized protein n=1 Tax=Pisolithus microcarpus 441 TaxID=765257 RepID=A0A0C9YB56_9AGAM|nr:hypothetical protein PISMIDRAFT_19692 [Pisolithus microcarpus 441]
MAASDPRKRSTQSDHTFLQETGPDTRKKPRKVNPADTSTHVAGTESMRRSSRTTKGSGGQIAQLRNIERIQTEQTATSKVSHASYLEMATANEPLNPLAPAKSKPKPKPRVKTSSACASNDGQLPKSLQEPTSLDGASPPTYQVAVEGSRYGFRLAGLDKQHEQDNITTAPTSHAGSVTPMSRGGSIAPTSRRGSIVPTSRRGSVLPVSRGSSVVPASHGGSIAPSSRGGSIPPSSHSRSVPTS